VSLTGAVKNQAGQWTVLGEKVRDAYYGYQAMGQQAGAVGNDMLALAIQEGEAGTKMSALNQAWDSWMSGITGGTSGMANLITSMENLKTTVTGSPHALTTYQGVLSATGKQFADDLTKYTGQGAVAWQNFDQVVGSTAPQLIDWLRTAGTMGAVSGKQIEQAGLDMIKGLAPLAVHSKAAQASLVALAEDAGANITTFPQLEALLKSTGAKASGLNGIIQTTTSNLGDMATAAQNLGDVMNTAMTTAMSQAALKASGFDAATGQLTTALQHNSANSPAVQAAAQKVTADWNKAQQMAGTLAQEAENAQKHIDQIKSKAVTISATVDIIASGDTGLAGVVTSGGSTTVYHSTGGGYYGRASGGPVSGPGTKTSDSVPIRASRGEYVMQAASVDHYGLAVMNAINSKSFASGGVVGGGGQYPAAL
jgi:hypothetical protein